MITQAKSYLKEIPKKRRVGLFIFVVLILVSIIVISHVFVSLLIFKAEVDITRSTLQGNEDPKTNYRWVSVDVYLYNPGGRRRTTVWVEITNQATNVSFSKTESVQIEYKRPIKLTIEFTLDKITYPGEFDHRVWLTYPNSQD